MLLGGNHPRDGEGRERLRLVLDVLDLEPDHGELVGEPFERLVGVEMLLQPGEGEFHDATLRSAKTSTRRKRSHISIMSSLNLPSRPKYLRCASRQKARLRSPSPSSRAKA